MQTVGRVWREGCILYRYLVGISVAGILACQAAPQNPSAAEDAASPGKGAIIPPDNRKDRKELGAGDPRLAFAEASVALVPRYRIRQGTGGTMFGVKASQPSLKKANGLCSGEKFEAQPGKLSEC